MEYHNLEPISRENYLTRLRDSSDEDAGEAVLRLAWNEPDPKWAERECVAALNDGRLSVREAAATGLGHLARRQKGLDATTVAQLASLKNDPEIGGQVNDALDDLVVFGRTPSEA